jgi:hypothetical protein
MIRCLVKQRDQSLRKVLETAEVRGRGQAGSARGATVDGGLSSRYSSGVVLRTRDGWHS